MVKLLSRVGCDLPRRKRICDRRAPLRARIENVHGLISARELLSALRRPDTPIGEVMERDPERGVRVFQEVLRRMVSMPGRLMDDGKNPGLFDQFAAVAQRTNVYTLADYAGIIRHLVATWKVPTRSLSGKAAAAQAFLCKQADRLESFAERVSEEVAQQAPRSFSWIHGRRA